MRQFTTIFQKPGKTVNNETVSSWTVRDLHGM